MRLLLLCLPLAALAHGPDSDDDGWEDDVDCAALDPSVFPGATEYCNDDIDNDCDGDVDRADTDCPMCGGERAGLVFFVVPLAVWTRRWR